MAKYFLCSFLVIIFLIVGCNRTDESSHSEGDGGSVTLWTTKSELFMEYPALIVGKESRFAVHLTWLKTFKPVTEGKLSLEFTSADGVRLTSVSEKPASPGIFRPTTKFEKPGTYHLTMVIDGAMRDTLQIEDLRVFASLSEIPPAEESSQQEQLIPFLKEQQWKIEFRTEPVERKRIVGTVRAACEVIPKLNNEAIVTAPFTGIIPAEENQRLPIAGQFVARSAPLAVMVPSAETPGGIENFGSRFIEAKSERELAEKEFERAKRLYANGLIAEKEFQEAEAEFARADATYQTLSKYAQTASDGQPLNHFTLRAPLAGTIIEAHVVPGKQVDAGEPLYRIINTTTLWIQADVASTEIGKLTRPSRAWLQLAGMSEQMEINKQNGVLISVANAIDPMTRTFPVIFEVRNPEGKLRVGMFGELSIATGNEKEALVISESALLEEEGRYSVYVQVEGEAFAKRDVTLGEKNGTLVEILSGLSAGEHVVTVGAYQVKLASLSSQLPAHGHEH